MSVQSVIVVGGGMVGAACALKLAQQGKHVTVIERQGVDLTTPMVEQAVDIRVSAINRASERLLSELGAFELLSTSRAAPYTELEAFEQSPGELVFSADQLSLSHLGHIIENNLIQTALWHQFAEHNIRVELCAEPIKSIENRDDGVTLNYGDKQFEADLLIGADGGRSQVRQLLGIGSTGWQYEQHCMGILIKLDAPQQARTWQEFKATGPVAFLPMQAPYANLIWYHRGDELQRLKSLDKAQLKAEILAQFPPLAGDFDIENVAVFPLTRSHAQRYHQGRCVLVGDAAHTINPLAGQGVNLGFKDVVSLAQQLDVEQPTELALHKYWQQRKIANLAMMSTMDACYFGFSNDIKPLRMLRGSFLKLAHRGGLLKDWVLKYAIGDVN